MKKLHPSSSYRAQADVFDKKKLTNEFFPRKETWIPIFLSPINLSADDEKSLVGSEHRTVSLTTESLCLGQPLKL